MIERRFVFRGRWSDRERYRLAWQRLVMRVRICNSVQMAFNGSKQAFEAAATLDTDGPTDAIRLIVDVTKPARVPCYPITAVEIYASDDVIIRRKISPKVSRESLFNVEPFFCVTMLATSDNYATDEAILEGMSCADGIYDALTAGKSN